MIKKKSLYVFIICFIIVLSFFIVNSCKEFQFNNPNDPYSGSYAWTQTPAPTFSSVESEYSCFIPPIAIDCNTEAEVNIYFTTDGTEPDTEASLYLEPVIITSDCTLSARAYVEGQLPSEVTKFRYILVK